jgi:tRNA modification GTPase
VGIVRVSGSLVKKIAEKILGFNPAPRHAYHTAFFNTQQEELDQGIALYFVAPQSFTGEDVLELQGHGGPVVMDILLKQVMHLGARLANPGEFSQRAFLNDKIDLTQAEAIADLINSASEQAARSALRSLQGAFSTHIHALNNQLIELRLYIEAAIDFASEEIDFLADGKALEKIRLLLIEFDVIYNQAKQGALLQEGMTVVIAGRPNAGKSSLLNTLAGKESAIVTEIAGTTRDVLREYIHIDGMPLHIIDTAGLRESGDVVEQEGIRRAWEEIKKADCVLLLVDSTNTPEIHPHDIWPEFIDKLPNLERVTVVRNKADLSQEKIGEITDTQRNLTIITTSIKTNQGIEHLREHLKLRMGFNNNGEGGFIARRRHLEALRKAREHIELGKQQLEQAGAGELLAEELRIAQNALSEITGEFTSDDLLGKIFGSFCIGK